MTILTLIASFRERLLEREAQLRCFHEYQSQLEGWLKGELLAFLDVQQSSGHVRDLGREVGVQTTGGRKKVDICFRFPRGRNPLRMELKHWHIGLQNRAYYGVPWYMRERHGSGIIGDVEKLSQIPDGTKYLLALATKNPGEAEWKEGFKVFAGRHRSFSLTPLTDPRDYPEFFFLGLIEVSE